MGNLIDNLQAAGMTDMKGSASQYEKPMCLRVFEYLYLKDERKQIPSGIPADAGGAAHDAIQAVLCDGLAEEDAIQAAQDRLREHVAIDATDAVKQERYIDDVVDMIIWGIAGCKTITDDWHDAELVPERKFEYTHPFLSIPIIGFIDLSSEKGIIEIKTKWNGLGPPKRDGTRGLRSAKLPTEPERSHVRQVAVYNAATGLPPSIVYATTTDYAVFTPDNCDLLRQESLDHHFNQILHNAIVWENLLSISTDPHVLKYWVQPNWDDFRWRFMPPEYLEQAKELFRI